MGEILSNGIAESKDVSIIILIDSPKVLFIKIAQKYPPTVFLPLPARINTGCCLFCWGF